MIALSKLISQTAIYGLSSIIGRFLNYLLVPLYTYRFNAAEYGVVSEFYAYAGFFAVVLVLGLETGYFRFRQKPEYASNLVYSNAFTALLFTNLAVFAGIYAYQQTIADTLHYSAHPEYIVWFAGILALDAISALPFAKLRAENKAWRFAGIKMLEIFITIALNCFLLIGYPQILALWPDNFLAPYYQADLGIAYIFMANLFASIIKLLLLLPDFPRLRIKFAILGGMLKYSLPMVIIGFAGMINEMLDRVILKQLLPYDLTTNLRMLGIYGACYKLSILMSLFVQAFRYAGEPFFFAMAKQQDAKQAYALVMKYFILTGVFIFLLVTLYIDFFQYFIGAEFREGLAVVPVLLLANLCLGIYINLSIWYKLSDRTGLGALISILGSGLTIGLNILWIPHFGYMGSAWATLACYAFMVVLSWLLGRIFYPVPYPLGKISFYLLLGCGLFFNHLYLQDNHYGLSWLNAGIALIAYLSVAVLLERKSGYKLR